MPAALSHAVGLRKTRRKETSVISTRHTTLQLRPDDILYIPNSLSKVVSASGIEEAITVGTGVLVYR
jgi:hypothetical protein